MYNTVLQNSTASTKYSNSKVNMIPMDNIEVGSRHGITINFITSKVGSSI